jgi:phosphatidylglycerol:prolipoprotein diacylglycerol transferase
MYHSLGDMLNIRNGGLAIHGGLIFGLITVIIMCRLKKVSVLDTLDLFIPTVALAQSIGRWGNYFNGEAHGGPTDLPWGILVDGVKVHPTFLYESLWCLFLFFFLSWWDRHRRKAYGQTFALYLILYSAERFCVEALRTDSLMIGSSGIRVSQLIGFCCFIIGLFFFIYFAVKLRNKPIAQCIYTESSPYYRVPDTEAESSEKSEEAEDNTDGKTDGDIGTEDDENV